MRVELLPQLGSHPLPAVMDVVHQHVFSQVVGAGEEGAAPVDARHAVYEVHQLVGVLEHEGVDQDVPPGYSASLP